MTRADMRVGAVPRRRCLAGQVEQVIAREIEQPVPAGSAAGQRYAAADFANSTGNDHIEQLTLAVTSPTR